MTNKPALITLDDGTAVVYDAYGFPHINLFNYTNSYCWMITAVQRLITSPTLREQVKKIQFSGNNLLIFKILEPLRILSNLDKVIADFVASYKKKTEKDNLIEKLKNFYEFANLSRCDGYGSLLYISKYVFPVIFYYSDCETLRKIMEEISISSAMIPAGAPVSPVVPLFNLNEEDEFNEIYFKEYSKIFVNSFLNNNQIAPGIVYTTEAELWTKDNLGHVVPVILGNDQEYYIFDDSRKICRLNTFLNSPFHFHKVKFNTASDYFRQYCEKNIPGNFKITESHVFLIITNNKNNELGMSGGGLIKQESAEKIDGGTDRVIIETKKKIDIYKLLTIVFLATTLVLFVVIVVILWFITIGRKAKVRLF